MILALRDGTSLSNPEIITVVLGLAVSLALMLLGWFSVSISSDLNCCHIGLTILGNNYF